MFLLKIGNLNWIDAPYDPHLSPNLTTFTLPDNSNGLALTIMLIDANTGKIKSIRLVGLSEKFSQKVIGTIMEKKMQPFNSSEYFSNIDKIYSAYTTKQLVAISTERCRLN